MANLDLVNFAILIGALLVLLGIFSSLVATRFGAPLLLVFLVIGMLAGEDGPGGLAFDDYRSTYLIGSLALSVILFDGGLRTKLTTFRGAVAPSLLLATFGVLVTAGLTGLAAWYVIPELEPLEALLLGGIVASTDAAAVFFLLRTGGLRLQPRIGSVLEIESGTNDPIAVFVTIVLTELLLAGGFSPSWDLILKLAQQGAIGLIAGVVGGLAVSTLLNRIEMPGGLHPLFVISGVIFIYAITSLAGGSGLLAVYLTGLVMANRPVRAYPSIVGFHDAATWLCQIVMFLVLGLLVTPRTLLEYALPGLAVAVALTFVARPAAVWLCLTPFGFGNREKLFASWVGLRGAVSIFLAAIPTLAGLPYGEVFFNVAFFVVLFSLLLQGWTLTGVARRLGVALRRTAANVHRFEIDIPGQVDQEMVGYPIAADSMILALSRMPPWSRLLLVVRENEILGPPEAGALRPGDYVYLLAPPDRVPRLDQLFVESPDVVRRMEPPIGELPVNGEARIGDIAAMYNLEVAVEDGALTVADYIAGHLASEPQPGNRIPLGNSMLVVRVVEEGGVIRAGLQLREIVDALVAAALARNPRLERMTARLRGRLDPIREAGALWRRLRGLFRRRD